LFFGGDIVMNFPISPNPNIFFFSAASPNISTVTFNGTANQTVPGSEAYGNLIIDNPLHVTLAGNITVNNQLNLVNGKVIAATRVVTLPTGATISGSSAAYICNGKLSRGLAAGAGPYWFYVGDTAKGYSPVTLSNLSANSTFEVTYFPVDASAASAPGPYPVTTKVTMLEKVSNLEYWMIDRAAGTGAAQVALGWNMYSGVNGNELNALRIAHWDGTRWADTGPNIYSGDATSGMVRTTLDINSFSPFTLASTTTNNFVLLDLQPKERNALPPVVTEGIHIYPNPARGNDITIQLPGTGRQTVDIRVIDPAGRIVHIARVATGNKKYILPLKQYASIKGIYLVQLLYSGRSLTSKVVVE
jgi:hypothetical protein